MHININLTLVIQMIHFGVAYYLLGTFLLKPAIAVRAQEDALKDAAVELISRRQQHIEQVVYAQHQVWRSCNAYFTANKPTIVDSGILRDLTGTPPEIEVSDQEKDKAIRAATDLIQKTIDERI